MISHTHTHGRRHAQGHSHGLLHESIKRSRDGLRAVGVALLILTLTAIAQTVIYVASGSVALLADLIRPEDQPGDSGQFEAPRPPSTGAVGNREHPPSPSAPGMRCP